MTPVEVGRARRRVSRRQRRAAARQRRAARARPDHRVQQPHVRPDEGRPDRRDAQRGLRPHLRAFSPTARPSSSSSTSSTRVYPEGRDGVQRDRGDRRHRQEGRGRDARRAPRFVAVGDRRDRQRDRLRDDDGGRAHPEGDRRPAAPHDSRGALERRGAGAARIAGVRQAAFRIVREPEAGLRAHCPRYLNLDTGTGPRSAAPTCSDRRRRPAVAARDAGAVRRSRRRRRDRAHEPQRRRHRQHVVQQRRAARASTSARIRSSTTPTRTTRTSTTTSAIIEADVKASAIVIAGDAVPAGDARRDAAAVHEGRHAAGRAAVGGRLGKSSSLKSHA